MNNFKEHINKYNNSNQSNTYKNKREQTKLLMVSYQV